jgi:hypothetical protein
MLVISKHYTVQIFSKFHPRMYAVTFQRLKKTRPGKEDSPPSILIKKSRNHRSRSRKSLNPVLPSLMGRIQTAHSATAKLEGGAQ